MNQENNGKQRRCIAYEPNGYRCFQLLKPKENGSWHRYGKKMGPRAVYDFIERNQESGEYGIEFGDSLAKIEYKKYAKQRKARDVKSKAERMLEARASA